MIFETQDGKVYVLSSLSQFGISHQLLSNSAELVSQLLKSTTRTITLLLRNRTRQQRNIGGLLSEWALAQGMSRIIDSSVFPNLVEVADHTLTISLWTADVVLQLVFHHLQLGFELELNQKDDLLMVFWYLDYILQRRSHISSSILRIKKRTKDLQVMNDTSKGKKSGSGSGSGMGNKAKSRVRKGADGFPHDQQEPPLVTPQLALIELLRTVSRAFVRVSFIPLWWCSGGRSRLLMVSVIHLLTSPFP